MDEQDECKACLRPKADIDGAVLKCEAMFNRSRCVWHAMQQAKPQAVARPDEPIVQPSEAEALRKELTAAQAKAAQLQLQLESEATARRAAQDHTTQQLAAAAQAQALADKHRTLADEARAQFTALESEVARLTALLQGRPGGQSRPEAGPVDPGTPSGGLRRFVAWLVATRFKLGSVSGMLGIALGASGGALLHHAPTVESASPMTQSGSAAPARSTSMQALLTTYFRQRGLVAAMHVDPDLNTVLLDDEHADAGQRHDAELIIKSAFAGAGLKEPTIRRPAAQGAPAIDTGASSTKALAGPEASGVSRPRKGASAVNLARDAGSGREHVEVHRVLPVDVAKPPPTEEPTIAPHPAGALATCNQRVDMSKWDPRRTAAMSICMHGECCRPGMMQNSDCATFDARYPLNCRN